MDTTNSPPNVIPASFTMAPITFVQVVAILKAYRKLILLMSLGLAAAALLYSKLAPKSYVASAQLLVDFSVNDPVSNRDFPSQLAASYLSTQVDLVNSPNVLLPAIDTLGWAKQEKYTEGFVQVRGGGGLREYLMEKVMAKNLNVRTIKDSRVMHISYEADTASEAARVANVVAETYIAQNRQSVAAPLQLRSAEYSQQLEVLRRKVDEAQGRVTEFRNQTGLVELDSNLDDEIGNLREMEQKLTDAEIVARAASTKRSQVARNHNRASGGDTEIGFLANPYMQSLKGQLVSAEAQFAELSKALGPRHPDYIAKQAEVNSLRQRLDRESGLYVGSVGDEAAGSLQAESSLRGSIEAQRSRILKIRSQQEEGASLVRELQTAKKIYERAVDAFDRVLLPAQGRYSNISMVSPALPPLKHTKPVARTNTLLGLIAGALLGTLLAFFLELRDRKVRCAEDVKNATGELPLLSI